MYRIPLSSPAVMAKDIKSRARSLDPVLEGIEIKHPLVQLTHLRRVPYLISDCFRVSPRRKSRTFWGSLLPSKPNLLSENKQGQKMQGKESDQSRDRRHPQSHLPLPSSLRCSAGLSPHLQPPSHLRLLLLLGPAPPLLPHKKLPVRRHLSLRHHDDCRDSVASVSSRHLVM